MNIKKPTINNITIWDGVCGMGKTTQAINLIKSITGNKKTYTKNCNKVIFATLYRSECFKMADIEYKYDSNKKTHVPIIVKNRIKYSPAVSRKFLFEFSTTIPNKNPSNKTNSLEVFKELVKLNKNITTTHSALFQLDEEALKLVQDYNYHIIIDEAPQAINKINFKYGDILKEDFKTLSDEIGVIHKDSDDLLSWVGDKKNLYLSRYEDLKKEISNGRCYFYKYDNFHAIIMWRMNPDIFRKFKSTTILTYLFEGTLFCAYLKLEGISYDLINKTFEEYGINSRVKEFYRFINLYEPRGLSGTIFDDYSAFTSTWYKKQIEGLKIKTDVDEVISSKIKVPYLIELGKKTKSFFSKDVTLSNTTVLETKDDIYFSTFLKGRKPNNKHLTDLLKPEKTIINERAWTTFKPYRKLILNIPSPNFNEDNFLVYNLRASNDYKHVKSMAFLVNVYPNTTIKTYLSKHKIKLDSDSYAISELIQWVFRSRIRDGKKINLFIASKRMRDLYKKWDTDFNILIEMRKDILDEEYEENQISLHNQKLLQSNMK